MYLQQICDRLNEAEVECPSGIIYEKGHKKFTVDYPAIHVLQFLPEEKIREIAGLHYQKGDTFIHITKTWGKMGCLQFEPYILPLKETDCPTLMAGTGHFVSLRKNGYVRASSDKFGRFAIQDSCFNLEFFINNVKQYKSYFMRSKLVGLMFLAVFTDVFCKYSSVRQLLIDKKNAYYSFINMCLNHYGLTTVYTFGELASLMSYTHGHIKGYRKRYAIIYRHSIIATIAFGYRTIQVEYQLYGSEKTMITLRVPDLTEGCLINTDDGELVDFSDMFFENIRYEDIIKMLLIMVLKYSGIDMSWSEVVPTAKICKFTDSNVGVIKRIHCLGDIKDISPDGF